MRLLRRYQCPFCDRHTVTRWGIRQHLLRPRWCELVIERPTHSGGDDLLSDLTESRQQGKPGGEG